MVAWVRYAPGSQASDSVVKLDVDLCDERGNVCAQLRGVSNVHETDMGHIAQMLPFAGL